MGNRWRVVVAAAIVLALSLGGCGGIGPRDSWPVGTCVRVSDEGGTATVSCAEPHTHTVIAIVAGDGEACPRDTDMYASPADPDDGLMTTCFRADAVLTFTFDVENRSRVPIVVSVASDTAATMPGFEPGQRGSISIQLLNRQNGISIEVQGAECRVLAKGDFPTPAPFTLLVEDAPASGQIRLTLVAGASSSPIPLPSNALVGCSG